MLWYGQVVVSTAIFLMLISESVCGHMGGYLDDTNKGLMFVYNYTRRLRTLVQMWCSDGVLSPFTLHEHGHNREQLVVSHDDQYEIILCSDNIAAMIMLTRAPAASHFMIPSSDHQIFSTQILSFQIYWLQPWLTRNRKCPTLNPPPIILAIFPILWTENSKVDHATPSNTLRNILSTFQKK